nr:immunoglobulin light chain junction region [Macaca mulatta]
DYYCQSFDSAGNWVF